MSRSVQDSYQADWTACNLSARDCQNVVPVQNHILNTVCRDLGDSHQKRVCVPCVGISHCETGSFTGAIGNFTGLITHRDVISRINKCKLILK